MSRRIRKKLRDNATNGCGIMASMNARSSEKKSRCTTVICNKRFQKMLTTKYNTYSSIHHRHTIARMHAPAVVTDTIGMPFHSAPS